MANLPRCYSVNMLQCALLSTLIISTPLTLLPAHALEPSFAQSTTSAIAGETLSNVHEVTSLANFIALNDTAGLADFNASEAVNFAGATLTLKRAGGVDAADQFGFYGNEIQLSAGSVLLADIFASSGQLPIGSYQLQPGQLSIEFNGEANVAAVEAVLRSLRYRNQQTLTSSSVNIEWTLSGASSAQQLPLPVSQFYTAFNLVNQFASNTAPVLQTSTAQQVFGSQNRIVGLAANATQGINVFSWAPASTLVLSDNGAIEQALSQPFSAFGMADYKFSLNKTIELADGSVIALANYDYELDDDWGGIYSPWLIKYLPDGSLDPNWKIVSFPKGQGNFLAQLVDAALDAEGRLLVLKGDIASSGKADLVLRYTADGILDESFRNAGSVTVAGLSAGQFNRAQRILPIATGSLVIDNNATDRTLNFLKLTADGNVDASFNSTGIYSSSDWYQAAMAVQGERIVLAQTHFEMLKGHSLRLSRLNADGSVDESFNPSINLAAALGDNVTISKLHTLRSGKLLVLASIGAADKAAAVVVRLNEDGTLDSSFANAGEFRYSPIPLFNNVTKHVLETEEGNLLLAGDSWLIRLTADGLLDTSFQPAAGAINTTDPAANLSYQKGEAPIQLFPGLGIFDRELAALGSYAGASIEVAALSSGCQLAVRSPVSISAGQLYMAEQMIASVSGGHNCKLKITFNELTSQSHVNAALQSITYANNSVSAPATESLAWVIDDGNQGAQGQGVGKLSGSKQIALKSAPYRLEMTFSQLSATQRQAVSFVPNVTYSGDKTALVFSAEGLPTWLSLNTATGELSGTPSHSDVGSVSNAVLKVTDGVNQVQNFFSVLVQANNQAPVISGEPAVLHTINAPYLFQPQSTDSDGDALIFNVQNLPAWAEFDSATGRISGTPQASDVGVYADITIAVQDQQAQSQLAAFSLTVRQSNAAPTISGQSARVVVVGSEYRFAPQAQDADGDSLRFSVSGQPAWTSFDSQTGLLQGIPDADDLGSYGPITIAVSDGQFTRELPAFTLSVLQQAIAVDDFELIGLQAKERFAASVALGDINADNFPEILLGTPERTQLLNGKKHVSAGGVDAIGADTVARNLVTGVKRQRLGAAVQVVADYDDDGINDVVVGKPGVGKFGEVALYSGADGSLIRVLLQPQQLPQVDAQISLKGRVGEVLAVADVNSDGTEDLIVGLPQSQVLSPAKLPKAGAVLVFNGFSSELLYVLRGTQRGEAFGRALAVDSELLYVGSPLFDNAALKAVDAGRVQVFAGSNGSWRFSVAAQLKKQFFGDALASLAADVNGDGVTDWLVSSPGSKDQQLQSYSGEQQLAERSYATKNKRNTLTLAAGADLDGDGVNDAVVGLPQADGQYPTEQGVKVLKQSGAAQVLLQGSL